MTFDSNADKSHAVLDALLDDTALDVFLQAAVEAGKLELSIADDGRFWFGFPLPCPHYRWWWSDNVRICGDCEAVIEDAA